MPVLIEAINVIVRLETIEEKYPGGFNAYFEDSPNATFCHDDYLTRVGFMVPVDVKAFCDNLKSLGFRFIEEKKSQEIVVVDQFSGPTRPCDWIEIVYARIMDLCDTCKFCRLKGDTSYTFAFPGTWTWEKSLSRSVCATPNKHFNKVMKFLRHDHERCLDVYLSLLTGKELYVGRAAPRLR